MAHTVKLSDYEGENSVDIELPFPPFPGLFLQAKWKNGGDYVQVDQVYWDATGNSFEVYAVDEEAQ